MLIKIVVEHKNDICMAFHKRSIFKEESENMVFNGYLKNGKDPERGSQWRGFSKHRENLVMLNSAL